MPLLAAMTNPLPDTANSSYVCYDTCISISYFKISNIRCLIESLWTFYKTLLACVAIKSVGRIFLSILISPPSDFKTLWVLALFYCLSLLKTLGEKMTTYICTFSLVQIVDVLSVFGLLLSLIASSLSGLCYYDRTTQ
jgi:hypothetical protein